MPRLDKITTVDFSRALYADFNRFLRPPGTFPRVSNFVYSRIGSLTTVDGSLIQSSLNGAGATFGQQPFKAIARFAQSGVAAKVLALQPTGTGKINLVDVTGSSWSGRLAQALSTYANPGMVQAGDKLALALGRGFAPQLWDGTSLTAITNTWTGAAGLPPWTKSVAFATGTAIAPGNGHIYIAIIGGTTNATGAPAFPTAAGATVPDGSGSSIVWKESGGDSPPAPPGADFLIYHGGFLFAWGNDTNYTNHPNLTGPDGLWQSDLNNFNSWNPLNAIFVGKGDGELPMGGAVFTLSEAGIPATSQLVLFKQTKTFSLLGFLPSATLQATPSGVGCNAPGSIQFFAELGIIRLAYRGFAVFDGQNDNVEKFTDPIGPYLFGGIPGIQPVDFANIGAARSFQTDNPRMYVCFVPLVGSGGTLVRGFAYDITIGGWTVIDLPWQISAAAYIPQNPNASLVGGANDGTIRRMFTGDQTWDGVPIQSSFRTPSIGEPVTPGYARRMVVRGQARGPGSGAKPTLVTLNYMDRDGSLQQVSLPPPQQVAGNIDVALKLLSADLDIGFQGQVLIEGFEWHGSKENPQPIEPTAIAAGVATVSVLYQSSGSAAVAANANSVVVTLPGIGAPNATYILSITPNWNTTFWVAQKTSTTFTVEFNVPAPSDGSGSIDWGAEITQ